MNILLEIAVAVLLGVIAWQDFKSRSISVILFPFVLVFISLHSFYYSQPKEALFNLIINLLFLVLQGVVLYYYLVLRHGKKIRFFRDYLGLGDVLLLVSISMLFTLYSFIVFIVSTAMVAILVAALTQFTRKSRMRYIPYAGIAALACIFYWSLGWTQFTDFTFEMYGMK